MNLKQKLLSLLFLVIILFLAFNKTNTIKCQIENSECPEVLIKNLNTLKGSSFFFSNIQKKLENNKTNDSIYILESISKKFPGTIKLYFKQEEIRYSLITSNKTFHIGNSGTTIPTESDYSEIISFTWKNEEVIINNNKINDDYHNKFLNISTNLSKNNLENTTITWVSDSEIILKTPNKPPFIFDKQTIETQVKKIDTIMNARELEEIEEPILEIDMRFNLPVLRTRQ